MCIRVCARVSVCNVAPCHLPSRGLTSGHASARPAQNLACDRHSARLCLLSSGCLTPECMLERVPSSGAACAGCTSKETEKAHKPGVVGVHGHSRVSQHGFRAGGGHHDLAPPPLQGVPARVLLRCSLEGTEAQA